MANRSIHGGMYKICVIIKERIYRVKFHWIENRERSIERECMKRFESFDDLCSVSSE
jgi:hypothetical protein